MDQLSKNLLSWIEAEIKAADSKLDKDNGFNVESGLFARIRKLKYAREVFSEFEKINKK